MAAVAHHTATFRKALITMITVPPDGDVEVILAAHQFLFP